MNITDSQNPQDQLAISQDHNVRRTMTRNGRQRLFTVIFGPDGKPKIPAFRNIQVSTMTVIAYTNMIIHIKKLLKYLPITPWTIVKKKRGRKKKTQLEDPNKDVPPGSIISLKHRKETRGVLLKPVKPSKGNGEYWKHSVSVVMILDDLKMLNVKVNHNGKLQMTGCKSMKHAIDFVKYLYGRMVEAENWTNEQLFTFRQSLDDPDENTINSPENKLEVSNRQNPLEVDGLWATFRCVMKNIDFDAGYKIRRNRLDALINHHTDFRSIFEGSISSNVNIKRQAIQYNDPHIDRLRITYDGECIEDTIPHDTLVSLFSEKDRKNFIKEAYHTFMIFASGRIIMSSSGPEMQWIFYQFVRILVEYRNVLEDLDENRSVNVEWPDSSTVPPEIVKSGVEPNLARDLDLIIEGACASIS